MSEGTNNRDYDAILRLLEDMRKEQSNTNNIILAKVDKIDSLERIDREQAGQISDLEKEIIELKANNKTQDEKINAISTTIRWAALLIVGAVAMAVINLVLVDRTAASNIPAQPPATLQSSSLRDDNDWIQNNVNNRNTFVV